METKKEEKKKFEEEWFSKMDTALPIVPREILNDITPENLQVIYKNGAMQLLYDLRGELLEKISRLEATLEAADKIEKIHSLSGYFNTIPEYHEALDKAFNEYNQLKSNQQSPNS